MSGGISGGWVGHDSPHYGLKIGGSMQLWVRMPTEHIANDIDPFLAKFRWRGKNKSDQIAMLMLYLVILHRAEHGRTSLSYTEFSHITGLSRAKIAAGLALLLEHELISKDTRFRTNCYVIENHEATPWGKLPALRLYSEDGYKLHAFHRFNLRQKNELNALKLYYLIIAFRNNATNYAKIGYDKITYYTGIQRSDIRTAISLLIGLKLIHVDEAPSRYEQGKVNCYRLVYLDSNRHRGTSGRSDAIDEEEF